MFTNLIATISFVVILFAINIFINLNKKVLNFKMILF